MIAFNARVFFDITSTIHFDEQLFLLKMIQNSSFYQVLFLVGCIVACLFALTTILFVCRRQNSFVRARHPWLIVVQTTLISLIIAVYTASICFQVCDFEFHFQIYCFQVMLVDCQISKVICNHDRIFPAMR